MVAAADDVGAATVVDGAGPTASSHPVSAAAAASTVITIPALRNKEVPFIRYRGWRRSDPGQHAAPARAWWTECGGKPSNSRARPTPGGRRVTNKMLA
ncbi:hypothetical protein JMUB6875_25170 [Nocardia sp. JMUB6875]